MKSKSLTEFEIIQNSAVGAHILYEFTQKFIQYHPEKKGPLLPFLFPVLPIAFTKEYSTEIASRNYKIGSLYKVLTSDNSYFINIDQKMQDLSATTYQAINLCFSSHILIYDTDNSRIITGKRVKIVDLKKMSESYQYIIKTSQRLGAWFGQLREDEIMNYFNITF